LLRRILPTTQRLVLQPDSYPRHSSV
jgi:hypothetical protein